MTWRDIAALFEKMELDLIKSLRRNLGDHKAWEKEEGFDWPAWQAEKLKHIKRYREQNEEIMKEYHDQISEETEKMLQEQYAEGYKDESEFFDMVEQTEDGTWQMKEPDKELDEVMGEEIKKTPTEDSFFGVNDNRMDKLIEDMQAVETKVESAALRMMDDVYRQTLYKAEMAMAAGATTLPQALDMAVKDFLNAGINCIEYKDGRRVNIDDYAQMALRTAATKAYMQGEAKKRDEMGIDTVLISQYGACSETCLPWQGRVYIDDVWGSAWKASKHSMAADNKISWPSGGTKISVEEYKSIMQYAREKEIELSGFKHFDGDTQTIRELIDDADSVARDYPMIKNGKKKLIIQLDENMNADDFAETHGHIVHINANAYRNVKKLAEEYDKLVREKWFVNGTDYHAIIKHEIGHVVANKYNVNSIEIAMQCTGLKNAAEVIDWVETNLSEYSATKASGAEIIAECFADAYGSGNPSKFALRFVKECGKMLM